ncbi:MAG: 50S ribosomal protein L10 [candidate division WOR-3 bacterium]|nr:50S ribosomal protein L10 [candidate division WOR-3 bacterium]
MPSQEKILKVEGLKKLVYEAKGIYFADCSRLKASDITQLRKKLHSMQMNLKVVKNRLALRALNELGIEGIDEFFTGPTALIFSYEDALVPAKVLKEFIKKNSDLKVKGAYVENGIYSKEKFDFLASLPTKSELRAQVILVLTQPVQELVFILESLLRQLIGSLEALSQKRTIDSSESHMATNSESADPTTTEQQS